MLKLVLLYLLYYLLLYLLYLLYYIIFLVLFQKNRDFAGRLPKAAASFGGRTQLRMSLFSSTRMRTANCSKARNRRSLLGDRRGVRQSRGQICHSSFQPPSSNTTVGPSPCWAQHSLLRTGVRGTGISLSPTVRLPSGPQNPPLCAPQAGKKRNTETFHPREVQSCLMPSDHWHGHPTAYGRAPAPQAPRETHLSQEVTLCLLEARCSSYRPRHSRDMC